MVALAAVADAQYPNLPSANAIGVTGVSVLPGATNLTSPVPNPRADGQRENNLVDPVDPVETEGETGAPAVVTPVDGGPVKKPKSQSLLPNEFQRFVLKTTGQSFPLFGASFFENTLNNVTDPNRLAVGDDYVLGVGDELLVRVWGSVSLNARLTIDRKGEIALPKLGTTKISGLKSSQVEAVIRALIAQNYKDFKVSVVPGRLRRITVYVVGQARNPGSYTLNSESTLTTGMFASGGPNPSGSIRRVQLLRNGNVISEFDLYRFLTFGDKSFDLRLLDGDVLVYPRALGHLAVGGKVNSPGIFEIKDPTETIGDFLGLAGGIPPVADPRRATLEHLSPNAPVPRRLDEFVLDAAGLRRLVSNGDIISVLPILPELSNVVSLRGHVAQPSRFAWKTGMRVSDVITGYSVLKTFETLGRQDEVRTDPPGISKVTRSEGLIGRLGGDSDSANLDYAVIERLGSTGFRPELLPFSIANVLADSKSPDNLTLLPGDIITVFSDKDVQVPVAKRRAFVRIEGEVNRPGVYQVLAGERLLGILEKAGGITPDSYLYGLAVYREGVRQSQRENIDRLLRQFERESSNNLAETVQNVGAVSDAAMFQARTLVLQKARQDALQRLRAIRPDGRLTLSLKPDPELDIGQIPDIRLSHADRIVIPPRPEVVYVSGAVNAEAALVYRKNADAASYLRIAGVSGAADRDAIFILRADGSAVTNQSVSWFNDLTKTIVMPGDVIVVPEKLDRESSWSVFIRNSKDITQTLFQLGLGAAAIKTLRQ